MKAALQFSGGKDSLACLHLLRAQWDDLLVVWTNAGAPFPETLVQMKEIQALVPYFHEIKSDVQSNIAQHGWPTDVLPVRNAFWGKATTGERGIMMQSWFTCCERNIWLPMHAEMKRLGITTIYRGQRSAEDYKAPISDGHLFEGVTYRFPIEGWTEAQVSDYLKAQGVAIPAHYEATRKSLDCWICTGYMDEKLDQMRYMETHHPAKHAVVIGKLREIRAAVHRGMEPLEAACK